MTHSFTTFLRFLQRDFYIQRKYLSIYIINFVFIQPLLFAFQFAYLQSKIFFGHMATTPEELTRISTIMFVGNILFIIMPLTYRLAIPLLFDFEGLKFVSYQISLLNPRLVLIERIFSSTLITFTIILPFYPFIRLLFPLQLDTSATSWPLVILLLFLASLTCCSYHYFVACFLKKSSQVIRLWPRANIPLVLLGGFVVPLNIILQASPTFGKLALLNPLIYITEGLRRAFTGSEQFLSIPLCIVALLGFSFVFTALALHYFKKRMDHI